MSGSDPVVARLVAAQAVGFAGWALGTAILVEAVSTEADPAAALGRMFERANRLLDNVGREGETEMIALARETVDGAFDWARTMLAEGK